MDALDAESQATLLPQCWVGERASQRPTNLAIANDIDRRGRLFRREMSKGAVQNDLGGRYSASGGRDWLDLDQIWSAKDDGCSGATTVI